jgi:hypothetical protein
VILVTPDRLADTWPAVAPWIAEAINRREGGGDENLIDVLLAIARGHYALWWEPGKFAAVAQIVNHPRQRVATILYCGGELESLLQMYESARRWCRQNGIDVIRIWGRAGWERALGMKRIGVILQESTL